jgi:hypothetical protein
MFSKQFSSVPTAYWAVGKVLSFPGTVEASIDFGPGDAVWLRLYPPKAGWDSFQVRSGQKLKGTASGVFEAQQLRAAPG